MQPHLGREGVVSRVPEPQVSPPSCVHSGPPLKPWFCDWTEGEARIWHSMSCEDYEDRTKHSSLAISLWAVEGTEIDFPKPVLELELDTPYPELSRILAAIISSHTSESIKDLSYTKASQGSTHKDRQTVPATILLHKSRSSQAALVPKEHKMFMEEAYNAAICFKMLRDLNGSDPVRLKYVIRKIKNIACGSPNLVLETIHDYFTDSPEISTRHKFRLFQVLETVIEASDFLEETWEKSFMKLALENMTKTTELEDVFQDAASNVLVAICKHSWRAAAQHLETEMLTGIFPHRSLLYVLGILSSREELFNEGEKACWEEQLAQIAAKSVQFLNTDVWSKELRCALTKPDQMQQEQPPEKAFLFYYYGLILQAAENSTTVRAHLQSLLETSHQRPKQREGMAVTMGLAAARHLDDVWAVLEQFGRSAPVRCSLHSFSPKGSEDFRWKWASSTILLAYGQMAAKAKAHILPWVDNVLSRMIFYFHYSSWDDTLKQSFLTAVLLLVGAISRNEGAHSYEFSQAPELLDCLMILMEKESPDTLCTSVRQQTIHIISSLCKLRPLPNLEQKSRLLSVCFRSVFALPLLEVLEKHTCLFLEPPNIQVRQVAERGCSGGNRLHCSQGLEKGRLEGRAPDKPTDPGQGTLVLLAEALRTGRRGHGWRLPPGGARRFSVLSHSARAGCAAEGRGAVLTARLALFDKTAEALDQLLQSFMVQTPTAVELHFLLSHMYIWLASEKAHERQRAVHSCMILLKFLSQNLHLDPKEEFKWTGQLVGTLGILCQDPDRATQHASLEGMGHLYQLLMRQKAGEASKAESGTPKQLRSSSDQKAAPTDIPEQAPRKDRIFQLGSSQVIKVKALTVVSGSGHAFRLWRALGAEPPMSRLVLATLLAWLQERPLPKAAGDSSPQPKDKAYLPSLAASEPPAPSGVSRAPPPATVRAAVRVRCLQFPAPTTDLRIRLYFEKSNNFPSCTLKSGTSLEFLYSPVVLEVLPKQAALAVLARGLQDPSPEVRVWSLQGLGNVLFHPGKGSLLRGQLLPFLDGFFQDSEPVVVRVMGTVSDVLRRLGALGAGAQSLSVAVNARSFFDDERDGIRAAAMALFGDLVAAMEGRELGGLRAQVYQSMVPLLLHLKDHCPAVVTLAWERGLSARHFLWTCLMTHSQEEFSVHLAQALSYLHSCHHHIKTWAALFIGYTICYHPQAVSQMVTGVDTNLLFCTFEDLKKDPEPGIREFAARQFSFLQKVAAQTGRCRGGAAPRPGSLGRPREANLCSLSRWGPARLLLQHTQPVLTDTASAEGRTGANAVQVDKAGVRWATLQDSRLRQKARPCPPLRLWFVCVPQCDTASVSTAGHAAVTGRPNPNPGAPGARDSLSPTLAGRTERVIHLVEPSGAAQPAHPQVHGGIDAISEPGRKALCTPSSRNHPPVGARAAWHQI
ncbi:maestro heat-like repeat family member 5 [Trichechus manatus latirostris]|uniref:Maestro heat-like repeat family member 5 n=1 Tax=Trichechus manatus latirostris TaxID=127582 RepID=A0A2Y9E6T0_TRIMA|nr:maestro heat-like repeat family member 5 [Trichechus manatus latirostris]